MADVAMVFHWPPDVLYGFSLSELMDWREQARKRTEPES